MAKKTTASAASQPEGPATPASTDKTSTSDTVVAAPVSRQRIPFSLDPFSVQDAPVAATLLPFRAEAVTKIYLGMQQIHANLVVLNGMLAVRPVPTTIIGTLHQPDNTAAARVQIQFDPKSVGATGPAVTVLTADDGGFKLSLQPGMTLPDSGLPLAIHGANSNAAVTIASARIASNGVVGVVILPQPLSALPVSILAALNAITANTPPTTSAAQQTPPQLPQIHIGENGSACAQVFRPGATVDRFPFGVFCRLVEPRLSIVTPIVKSQVTTGGLNYFPLASYVNNVLSVAKSTETSSYVDRVPVEQPLSADGFLDQIAGLNASGVFVADETVPMAASLGLGYVLWMSQQWSFDGLGLGDLVYSLPLAPGEQQQVAVFERRDTSAVYESEFFSEQEAQSQIALADTSTNATFHSAFSEVSSGGSAFHASSASASFGIAHVLFSGGAGASSSGGSSGSWMQGQRDTAQQAAQTTHSAAESQAAARRTAARTGMRMATASESESVTTKTITNHNHGHALTMQYWEVLRMYDVSTGIDGLTLCCLIPMQIVRFMPPGQPFTIGNPATLSTRAQVLARYANIIKHLDVLQRAVPRTFQYGLTLLAQFAADPTAKVEPQGGVAEDVIQFQLTGSFLFCDTVSVVALTKRNTRVGPVQLVSSVLGQPPQPPVDKFTSKDELVSWLTSQRQTSATVLQGSLALPPSMNRADIIGFEISRTFKTLSYTLVSQEMAALNTLQAQFGSSANIWLQAAVQATLGSNPAATARPTVTLTASDLEKGLGGPTVTFLHAAIEELDASGNPIASNGETYANDPMFGTVLPPQPFPVPALQIAPVLRFGEILEIEKTAHHIIRNTTLYSKAVWLSLTADERAILLDGYTIGVPTGGISDESQMVPLLNCIQNKLLGFFGNSMIMPFMIPQAVAEQMGLDPAQIQQSLLAYQQASFVSPRATVALPTHGVLGEAVLGHCSSAEKIDITRFWNWQDSPADTAPAISPVTLPTTTPSISGTLTAPNSLTNLPTLINNVLQAPTPNTALLQALGAAALAQQDFNPAITGAALLAPLIQNAQTTANSARADALATSKALTAQAMATAGNIAGAKSGAGNTAGSDALLAVAGVAPKSDPATTSKTDTTKTPPPNPPPAPK
jgi:uncharacterized membrane protein YgcG